MRVQSALGPLKAEESPQGYSVQQIVIIASLSLITAAAIIGNLLVCIAVLTNRRLRQNSYFFNVSLAVADIVMAVAVMPFAIVNDLSGNWPYGAAFCNFWIALDLMCTSASILNLCAIALDRYLVIRDPFSRNEWMNDAKTAGLISAVWIMSALVSFLPFFSGWHNYFNSAKHDWETETCDYDVSLVYALTYDTVSFWIPCIVMVVIYSKMLGYARYHSNEIKRTTLQPPGLQSVSRRRRSVKRNRKALWTLGTIMGAFLACWLPFFIVDPIYAQCPTCVPPEVSIVVLWFGFFNACLNPIIYSVLDKDFRSAFRQQLCPCQAQGKHVRVGAGTTQTLPTTGTRVTHTAPDANTPMTKVSRLLPAVPYTPPASESVFSSCESSAPSEGPAR